MSFKAAITFAVTFAGVGFGNAVCHLPHGMSYPVAGMMRKNVGIEGCPERCLIIPNGMPAALNAPAVFGFTVCSNS